MNVSHSEFIGRKDLRGHKEVASARRIKEGSLGSNHTALAFEPYLRVDKGLSLSRALFGRRAMSFCLDCSKYADEELIISR